jgi:DNA-binding protein H-NS
MTSGLSIEALAELRDGLVEGRVKPSKRLPKYRKGEETWSGAGSQPKWMRDHLAGGGTLELLPVRWTPS